MDVRIESGTCPYCGHDLSFDQETLRWHPKKPAVEIETKCSSCGWEGVEVSWIEFGGYESKDIDKYPDDLLLI